MSNFIQHLQVNQNFQTLTQYGGISPLANSKWWIGISNEDPRENPLEVFIIDVLGQKQVLQQPIHTDDKGNFIESIESQLSPAIHPQIEETKYSVYIEVITDGHLSIYQRRIVPVFLDTNDFVTQISFSNEQNRVNAAIADLQSQINAK